LVAFGADAGPCADLCIPHGHCLYSTHDTHSALHSVTQLNRNVIWLHLVQMLGHVLTFAFLMVIASTALMTPILLYILSPS